MARNYFDRERDEATIRLVRNPNLWPCWPVLPMKSTHEKDKAFPAFPRMGYLQEDEDFKAGKLKLREGNIGMLSADDPVILEVDCAEALLARGWVVD